MNGNYSIRFFFTMFKALKLFLLLPEQQKEQANSGVPIEAIHILDMEK